MSGIYSYNELTRVCVCVCDTQVLDKYGDIYGRERIAELLGMDLASLDVSAMTHEKKPEPDTSMLSWYGLSTRHEASRV